MRVNYNTNINMRIHVLYTAYDSEGILLEQHPQTNNLEERAMLPEPKFVNLCG